MTTFSIELKDLEELKADRKTFERKCGIYFLWEGEEIVYIGQSVNGDQRLSSHFQPTGRRYDYYSFVPVEKERLGITEYAYIAQYQPKYNVKK